MALLSHSLLRTNVAGGNSSLFALLSGRRPPHRIRLRPVRIFPLFHFSTLNFELSSMPHIALPEGLPGITSGFAFRPETAKPMRELAEVLLRGPNTLTSGEREMIAAYVSSRNDCHFCQASHSAAAAHHLDGNYTA